MTKTIIHDNKTFTYIPKGKGFYWICRETSEILSTMRPNSPLVLKPSIASSGYYLVGFFTKQDRINVNIHRCMAEVFLPNTENFTQVNHIDGNKLNNSIENLEWCTPSQNALHAYRNRLSNSSHCSIEVHKYLLDGTYVTSYKSMHEAADKEGVNPSDIHNACNKKTKTAAKAQWSYDLLPSIDPYEGFNIVNYYIVDDVKVYSSKELESILDLSRASIHRRIKKHGSEFTHNNLKVQIVYSK